MAGELRERYDEVEIELIKGGGGAFEVRSDGQLIFSKLAEGRFPEAEEIFEALDN